MFSPFLSMPIGFCFALQYVCDYWTDTLKGWNHKGGMSMEQRAPLQSAEILWINWSEKILSFTKVDGFEAKHFLSHESCLEYAFDKATDGFRVQ